MTGTATTREKRTAAEWVTFAVASAIVLTLILLILTQVRDGNEPPALTVAPQAAREAGGRFYVPVEVANDGEETAANVQVVASLTIGDTTTDADQVIDFLAGGESATLVFSFDDDPADGELEVTVAGYAEP